MAYIKKEVRHQIQLLDEHLQVIGFPEKWNEFLEEEKRKEYLIIKNKNDYHCLYCNKIFRSNKKVNEYDICPNCQSNLLVKSDRLKHHEVKKDLTIIQKYNKKYVFRTFELFATYSKNKLSFSIVEYSRRIKDKNFITTNFYISNNFKNNMGNIFIAHYEETKEWRPYNYYYCLSENSKFYYYNFKELFYNLNKYSMIWELAKNIEYLNFYDVAEDCLLLKKNTAELLTKAKLYNLANDCKTYRKKGTFEEIFGVDRSYLEFMIENNITSSELEVLSKIKIKDIELIRYLNKFYNLDSLLKYCKPIDLYNYKLKPENVHEYLDYLKFAKELGFNLRDKKYLYPKHLKQKHDEFMEQVKINKDKKINRKIKAKYKKLLKNQFQNHKYIIFPAQDIESLIEESKQQNNCVKTYAERIANDKCDIYFMRYLKTQEKSLVTIEVKNNKVVQQRIKNNDQTTLEQKKFLERWEQKVLNK